MMSVSGFSPPISRKEFEEKNRRIARAVSEVPAVDIEMWQRGRDWLATQALGDDPAGPRRNSPRVQISIQAHLAGVGPVTTENVSFNGLAIHAGRYHGLLPGDETSVRVAMNGRSVYALARVAWTEEQRVGIAFTAIHPTDERSLQAAVCDRLLAHWH